MPSWKKILTKTPVALDLGASASDGYVLTATGGDATTPAWEAVGAGSDTTYTIKAETVSGGADLDLDAGGSGSVTDTIKFASAGATTVSRTSANEIRISSLDTQPCGGDGHAKYAITDTFASTEVTAMQNIGATTITADQWGYLGASSGTGDGHTKYAITDTFAAGEVTQLQLIGTTTISADQWGYLGASTSAQFHSKYTDANAVTAINATSSISTTCDQPISDLTAGTGIDVVMTTVSTDLLSNGGIVLAGVASELQIDLSASNMKNQVSPTDGGTGLTSYTTGDLLYATAANTLGVLAGSAGNSGKYLQAGMTGVPTWVTHSDSNTWRGVSAGGNALGATEALDLGSGGSNITITETGGTVTINGTAGPCGGDGHAKYAITDTFIASEVTAMQNINAVTITNAQWGYLGASSGSITNVDTYEQTEWDITADAGGSTTIAHDGQVDIAGGSNITTANSGGTITIAGTAGPCGGDGHAKYAITDTFASTEVTAVKNIDSVTITNAQWGYLGAASGAITNTDANVDVGVLETRLPQIDTAVQIGNGVTITMGGALTVTGDLVVNGNTITTDTETLEVGDNKIVLNSDLGENAGVDTGFIAAIGTDDTQMSGNNYNPTFYYDVSAKRWVMGETADATPFSSFGDYVSDVMQVRIDSAAINTNSSEVPVGHLQYHSGELHLRVA